MESKAIALKGLKGICRLFLVDLEALPEDAYDHCFGGSTRTVADIVYEVNMVNDHVGMTMRGETPFDWPDEGWIRAPESFRSKDVVTAAFEESSKRLIETVDALTTEEFDAPIKTADGETTRFERCRFVTLHMWYHCGQVNFMQSLLGDDAWHWK